MNNKPTQTLDATGLLCPLPVLRAARLLRGMKAGDVLEVSATDPASKTDMAAFCAETGHELLDSVEKNGIITFTIKVREK